MVLIRYNNSLSYIVMIEAGWRYNNEIFITIITLFFFVGKYQIITLTNYHSYLKLLRYNNGIRNNIYEIWKLDFRHDAKHNGKYWNQIFINTEVLANRNTATYKYISTYE